MSSDRPKDAFEKAAAANGRLLKTNDQLKPQPPANAPPRMDLAPPGMVGTQPPRLSPESLRRNADLYRALAEKKQRQQALTKRGGLQSEFDRER